jgi:alpha-glucoside transport system permease protein
MAPKIMKQGIWAPIMYLLPALIIMSIFVVFPMFNTIRLSFLDSKGENSAATTCLEGQPCWGAFENYRYALTNPEMVNALKNNALWLILMVPATVIMGLLIALLADRVKYEPIAKSLIFMPVAISFIGAGIIWRFIYSIQTGDGEQYGVINAILVALGKEPIAFMSNPAVNNYALMIVGVWLWAGFCMTILSAALKSVPGEVLEAARVDGANEFQVFFKIMLPIVMPTVVVVTTTMVINVLKIFDIVFVMTGGNFGTEVIANRMFKLIVTDTGRSMAIAVLLVVLTIPVMIFNVSRFRQQEKMR